MYRTHTATNFWSDIRFSSFWDCLGNLGFWVLFFSPVPSWSVNTVKLSLPLSSQSLGVKLSLSDDLCYSSTQKPPAIVRISLQKGILSSFALLENKDPEAQLITLRSIHGVAAGGTVSGIGGLCLQSDTSKVQWRPNPYTVCQPVPSGSCRHHCCSFDAG